MKKKFENLSVDDLSLERLQKDCIDKGWLVSLFGIIVAGLLLLIGKRPKDYHGICPYFETGKNWGGVSFGWFFIIAKNCGEKTRNHEVGHIIQNTLVGGFPMMFYTLGSFCRYWKRAIFGAKTDYDAWWFEGQATELGTAFVEKMKGGEKNV
jgi:hypothetical protein